MKRFFQVLVVVLLPVLMMLQAFQAYRYAVIVENIGNLDRLQVDKLEENNKLLAAIAVFRSPERIYGVADSLGLKPVEAGKLMQVEFPGNEEEQ